MSVRKSVFLAFAAVLLFAATAFAFPYDRNPSTIDSTATYGFIGDWGNQLRSLSVNGLRVLQFMINEFNTTGGGPGGAKDLKIWNTPSFYPNKLREDEASWNYLLANPGAAVPVSVGRSLFTTHNELIDFIEKMPRKNLTVEYLGEIPKGFPFPFLIFSKVTKDRTPAGLKATGLPLVWIQGNIHGGEWSGGEGALALAYDLANGRYDDLLDGVNVLITPRVCTDGAKYPRRETSDLVALQWTPQPEIRDLNRDNMLLDLQVTRAMRKMNMAYGPHFCVDLHERSSTTITASVTTRFGVTIDNDAGDIGSSGTTILQVPRELTRLRYEYMEPDLAAFGAERNIYFGLYRESTDDSARDGNGVNNYTSGGVYYDANLSNGFVTNSAFDPDAPYYVIPEAYYNTRSSRNINAFPGVVSQLFENKSGPVNTGNRGMWERRVGTAYICSLSTITTASTKGKELLPKIMEIRKSWVENPPKMIPILTIPPKPMFWNQGSDAVRNASGDFYLKDFGYKGRDVGYTVIDISELPTTIADVSIKDGIPLTRRYDVTKAMKYVGPGLGRPNTKDGAYIPVSDDTGTRDYQMFKFEHTWLGWNLRERIRPYAYIFEGEYADELATRMLLAGIEVKRLAQDMNINVEGWHYNNRPYVDLANSSMPGWRNRDVSIYEIPNRSFKKDSYVVFIKQLLTNLIPMYMEPDLPWNVASCIFLPYMSVALGGASTGSLHSDLVGREMPAYRIVNEVNIPTYEVDHFLPLVNRGAAARFFSYHTQEEIADIAKACGENSIKVYDYDFQVHARYDDILSVPPLANGRKFDITLPTSENTKKYLILGKDGTYQELRPHSTMIGWNVATVMIDDHGLVPFTVAISSDGRPVVGDGSNRTLPRALPARDDLIGVRIVEVTTPTHSVEEIVRMVFKDGKLPEGAKIEDGYYVLTTDFIDSGVLLKNSGLKDGWSIASVNPASGKNWSARIVNGEAVVNFDGYVISETATLKIQGATEYVELNVKFSGNSSSGGEEVEGCNAGYIMLTLLAVCPLFMRRKGLSVK